MKDFLPSPVLTMHLKTAASMRLTYDRYNIVFPICYFGRTFQATGEDNVYLNALVSMSLMNPSFPKLPNASHKN